MIEPTDADIAEALHEAGFFDWNDPEIPSYIRKRASDGATNSRAILNSARTLAKLRKLVAERDRLRDDVAIWKGEASNRSQGMIDLNLDRAAMGVENLQLREEVDRLRALEAEVYNRAIEDAAKKASCHGQFSRDDFSRGIMRGHENAANAIRALTKKGNANG